MKYSRCPDDYNPDKRPIIGKEGWQLWSNDGGVNIIPEGRLTTRREPSTIIVIAMSSLLVLCLPISPLANCIKSKPLRCKSKESIGKGVEEERGRERAKVIRIVALKLGINGPYQTAGLLED
ncbi:hypothetical protein J6590_060358 [Homalodisca vitripennis]|nr:hypothetical protein J6590_060358 [Homalodisca vitripennis]